MRIVDLNVLQIYDFSWSEEIAKYLAKKLQNNYSENVCNQMINKVLSSTNFPKFYGDLVIKLNDSFYVLKDKNVKKVNIDELLPVIKVKNSYLMDIYMKNNWEHCICSIAAAQECELKSIDITVIEVVANGIEYFYKETEIEIINNILSEYLCGEVLKSTLEKFEELICMKDSLPLHFIIDKEHYFGYIDNNGNLKLRKRKISIENIEMILKEAFNEFDIVEIQDIITLISNKIIFGIKEDYLIRVIDWKNDTEKSNDDIKGIGLYFYNDKAYKFYTTFENYKEYWYSIPVPKFLYICNKNKFEYIEINNYNLIKTTKKFNKLALQGPIKLEYGYQYKQYCIYDGKKIKLLEGNEANEVDEDEVMVIVKMDIG